MLQHFLPFSIRFSSSTLNPPFRKIWLAIFLWALFCEIKMLTHTGNNSDTRRCRDQFGFQSFPTITSNFAIKNRISIQSKNRANLSSPLGVLCSIKNLGEIFTVLFCCENNFLAAFFAFSKHATFSLCTQSWIKMTCGKPDNFSRATCNNT